MYACQYIRMLLKEILKTKLDILMVVVDDLQLHLSST